MLVLSRMKGQQIVVGGTITVTVLDVRGDKVKLGFQGPAETPIHRMEVYERLRPVPPAEEPSLENDRSLASSVV